MIIVHCYTQHQNIPAYCEHLTFKGQSSYHKVSPLIEVISSSLPQGKNTVPVYYNTGRKRTYCHRWRYYLRLSSTHWTESSLVHALVQLYCNGVRFVCHIKVKTLLLFSSLRTIKKTFPFPPQYSQNITLFFKIQNCCTYCITDDILYVSAKISKYLVKSLCLCNMLGNGCEWK